MERTVRLMQALVALRYFSQAMAYMSYAGVLLMGAKPALLTMAEPSFLAPSQPVHVFASAVRPVLYTSRRGL